MTESHTPESDVRRHWVSHTGHCLQTLIRKQRATQNTEDIFPSRENQNHTNKKLFILPFDSGFWVLNLSGRSSLASDEDQSREMNWNGWWEFVATSFIPGLPRKICPIGIPWHPSILFVFVTWALSNSMSESQPAISRYLLWLFGSLRARQINN